MVLQMRPPVEDKIQSAQIETTTPEQTPALPQMHAEAAELGRAKILRPTRLLDRGNWLLLIVSGAVLTTILVMGMFFSSLNGSARPSTT